MSKNLWPDFEVGKIKNPKTILVEQANFLGEQTKNILNANVSTGTIGADSKTIVNIFEIIAPMLDNYKYQLFNIRHGVLFYPLSLFYNNVEKKLQMKKS